MSPPLLRILRDLTEEFQRSKPLEIPVYILRAAVNCGQNRKSQCKMRQRSSRSERRKMALPSVARRIKDTGRTASELVRKLVFALNEYQRNFLLLRWEWSWKRGRRESCLIFLAEEN